MFHPALNLEFVVNVVKPNFSVGDYAPVSSIPELQALMPGPDFTEQALIWSYDYEKRDSIYNRPKVLYKWVSKEIFYQAINGILDKYPDTNKDKRSTLYYSNEPIRIYATITTESYRERLSKQQHYTSGVHIIIACSETYDGIHDKTLKNKYGDSYVVSNKLYSKPNKYPFVYNRCVSNLHGIYVCDNKVILYSFKDCISQYTDGSGRNYATDKKQIYTADTLWHVLDYARENDIYVYNRLIPKVENCFYKNRYMMFVFEKDKYKDIIVY